MAKRTFTVRANFPVQDSDLVETVSATSWTAALGAAARAFKRRMKGSRIKAASFTIMQVSTPGAIDTAPVQPVQAQLPTVDTTDTPEAAATNDN